MIKKALNIYTTDNVRNNLDEIKLKYPLRKLNDVLYPLELRVVSIGTDWTNFSNSSTNNTSSELNSDYSAELCCGTHAANTSQLEEFVITHFSINGDSSFEIDACTSKVILFSSIQYRFCISLPLYKVLLAVH